MSHQTPRLPESKFAPTPAPAPQRRNNRTKGRFYETSVGYLSARQIRIRIAAGEPIQVTDPEYLQRYGTPSKPTVIDCGTWD